MQGSKIDLIDRTTRPGLETSARSSRTAGYPLVEDHEPNPKGWQFDAAGASGSSERSYLGGATALVLEGAAIVGTGLLDERLLLRTRRGEA